MPTGTPKDVETPQRSSLFPAVRPVALGDADGVLVAAALAASLTLLTLSVLLNGPTAWLDRLIDLRLPRPEEGPSVLHSVAVFVSTVANPPGAISVVAAVVLGWSAFTRSRWPLFAAVPSLLGVVGTVLMGKRLVGRPGPPDSDSVSALGGLGSFPSGHTATALVCAGALAVLLGQVRPRLRGVSRLAAGAWTLLVGWSMVWLHYHWLSDVVGAILLVTLALWLLYRWPLRLA